MKHLQQETGNSATAQAGLGLSLQLTSCEDSYMLWDTHGAMCVCSFLSVCLMNNPAWSWSASRAAGARPEVAACSTQAVTSSLCFQDLGL